MKTLITLIFVAFTIAPSIAQEKNIGTYSVSIENLIPFIVDNYAVNNNNNDELAIKNLTFLIQVSEVGIDIERQIVLKQAFKLLSRRLTEEDNVSMVTYSVFKSIALKQTSPKDLKKILFTINDYKSSVKEFHKDGIELAYTFTKENFIEEAKNSVIMTRIQNTSLSVSDYNNTAVNIQPKKKNNAVLITAISLLPELLAIIKN